VRIIPKDSIRAIEDFLRARGADGLEGVVLLAGPARGAGPTLLDTLILPEQVAQRSLFGCSVEIPREEIAALTSILRARSAQLHVKIHTHPTDAYHSELDLSNMLMQFDQALSIVVPDFCADGLNDLRDCDVALYEAGAWDWRDVTHEKEKHVSIGPGKVTTLDRT
jgi:hypothetical protein